MSHRPIFAAFKETLFFDWTSEPIDACAPLLRKRGLGSARRRASVRSKVARFAAAAALVLGVGAAGFVATNVAATCSSTEGHPILERARGVAERLRLPLPLWCFGA